MSFRPDSSYRMLASVVALIVAAAGIFLDALLIRVGLARIDVLILSNLLTGGIAGIAYWLFAIRDFEQRAADIKRLEVIAEMNHHVRNALQVIVYYCAHLENESQDDMKHAVERIQWSLKTILPQIDQARGAGDLVHH
jgi:hypothetical protein